MHVTVQYTTPPYILFCVVFCLGSILVLYSRAFQSNFVSITSHLSPCQAQIIFCLCSGVYFCYFTHNKVGSPHPPTPTPPHSLGATLPTGVPCQK